MKSLRKSYLKRQKQLKYAIAECKILMSISHPFIITLHYSFQTPANLYMVFDYCSSGDLQQLLKKVGCLSEKDAKIYIV